MVRLVVGGAYAVGGAHAVGGVDATKHRIGLPVDNGGTPCAMMYVQNEGDNDPTCSQGCKLKVETVIKSLPQEAC